MGRLIGLTLVLGLTLCAQQPPNPALQDVDDVAGLPRVLLIGDSISIGYTIPVRELLKGKANVHRILTNGGPTINGLDHISEWLGDGKWDVIHFNWGLHDLKIGDDGVRQVPLEKYEQNLRQLVARLRQTGARLIFASTTPVPEGKVNPPRINSDVIGYNAAAAKIMQENGIPIDDLYSLAMPQLKTIQLPVNVHYTPEGYNVLAAQVADSVLKELARK
jgi:GDSL-like Lipase/Acylhydrolase family